MLEAFVKDGETIPVIAGTGITLRFDGGTLRPYGTVSGSAGCNTYGAAYAYRDSNRTPPNAFLMEDPAGGAEMTCYDPTGIMEQERRYLSFLEDVRDLSRYAEGGSPRDDTPKLELTTNDGRELVFVTPPP